MPKLTSVAEQIPMRVVIVTMDTLASGLERAIRQLEKELPGLRVSLHAACEWNTSSEAVQRCRNDIAEANIIFAGMLFLEDHFQPILDALKTRRDKCDAIVCALSAGEVVRLTRMGRFSMDGAQGGALAFLKRLRGERNKSSSPGAQQLKMLRRVPQILRFIPGAAQDVRAYFLSLQYWIGGSEENITNLLRMLIDRFAEGPRRPLRGRLKVAAPIQYPDVGVYHPRLKTRITDRADHLPAVGKNGTVGILMLRSYLLSGNTAHYDGVIAALESRGLNVIPAFASGLDSRPAVERYFMTGNGAKVDAVVSLSGFSLVGGPAYNDARAAEEMLAKLDVPYISAVPVELQTLEQWEGSERGLLPVESTIMVAIPELDGATGTTVFGGRSSEDDTKASRDMRVHNERANRLAERILKLVRLRRSTRADRKVAIVLFNFPPNAGNTGTAAYLSVFASLHRTMQALANSGYQVDVPKSVDALRDRIIAGNSMRLGSHANVVARIAVDDHIRRERYLGEIETQWGPAPGRQQSDGSSIFVLGERFGNIFVGIQPAFGYEGDPMRLLFERGFAPTHAFSAFYRYLREDFGAHAVLHFGTHGALEFMPGKQAGLCEDCWPERLIADLPNFYLYAANNPSEGTIAKRRSAATLISYLTPPIAHAGLYRGLLDLKASLESWRKLAPEACERSRLTQLVQSQAAAVDLAAPEPAWNDEEAEVRIGRIGAQILELEYTLIPHGLHVVGEPLSKEERIDMLVAIAESSHATRLDRLAAQLLVEGASPDAVMAAANLPPNEVNTAMVKNLAVTDRGLGEDSEVTALIAALDGRFIRPAPGGDVLRTPAILPTGRNLHGFDPFRIPSAFAMKEGELQAKRLIERHMSDGQPFPESIAMVLWATDNLKSEGGPLAQALALMGARPRFDSFGRLAGATLIPLEELGRPRIDVVITLSGIFRDLMPLQIKLHAEAAYLAACADEPVDRNFVHKHALEYQKRHGCDMETASLRVFGNAEGTYGSNVNHLVESSRWEDEDELAETYTRRKSFAYGRSGRPVQQAALLNSVLEDVQLAYQNLDSVELGVTTINHYFDTLGGISQAVRRAKGGVETPVYIGDQTRSEGIVRTLAEQVSIEARTRMLNPKWYEGMLRHGYEGVRQIEEHVTNTMGWSATTGQVAPWVYKQLTETFVLDAEMRERMAKLNPTASAKVASRLLEAHERKYWTPDKDMLEALQEAGEELEDRLEGVGIASAAAA
jgi:magnesium chelatase subunit H